MKDTIDTILIEWSQIGTMFIRLLIRAVGSLGVEDDVERMLLDG